MEVESVRFGRVVVTDDQVVRLVRPLLGFGELQYFAFLEDEESAPVLWMQSLEAPEILFPVVDAGLVVGDHALDLDDPELAALGIERAEDARRLVVLTLSPDPALVTANLRAPIVWNTRRATAMQVVEQDPRLSVRHPLRAAGEERRSNKEVARACPDPTQG